MTNVQVKKAEAFRALHHSGKLLVLPNIWDVVGARLLEKEGFPVVATASASIAYSNGYNDGEIISFEKVLYILKEICQSTILPVSADIEKGYASDNHALRSNIKALLDCGIVGINFEDSAVKGEKLFSLEEQCVKIGLIRETAECSGIPLVINARTDIFLMKCFEGDRIEEAVKRCNSYRDAGADCFYPILCSMDELKSIKKQTDFPLNVIATKDTLPMHELETMGIARLSVGPGLLKAALTKMREVIRALKNYGGYELFTQAEIMTSPEILEIIR